MVINNFPILRVGALTRQGCVCAFQALAKQSAGSCHCAQIKRISVSLPVMSSFTPNGMEPMSPTYSKCGLIWMEIRSLW